MPLLNILRTCVLESNEDNTGSAQSAGEFVRNENQRMADGLGFSETIEGKSSQLDLDKRYGKYRCIGSEESVEFTSAVIAVEDKSRAMT